MLKEIFERYTAFSDSWISKIQVVDENIVITITCANKRNNYKYEMINLIFGEVIVFKNNYKQKGTGNIGIKDALLTEKDDLIVFDLDPIDHFDFLEENENSNFKIIAKNISYEFREYYER